jgi:RNA polymerase sigma factor (sigma-70 family)
MARKYTSRLGVEPEDLAQELRLALWLARDQIAACQNDEHRVRYVSRRLYGAAIDAGRAASWCGRSKSEQHRMPQLDEIPDLVDDEHDPADEVDRQMLLRALEQRLSADERRLTRHVLEGKTLSEMADADGVGQSAISHRFKALTERVTQIARMVCS